MRPDTIIKGINYLALATNQEVNEDRMAVYVDQLSDLKRDDLFAETVASLAKDAQWMPKISEIRGRYRELLMSRAMQRPALGAGDDAFSGAPGDLHDWCLGCNGRTVMRELRRNNGWCDACGKPDIKSSPRWNERAELRSV